MRDVKGSLKQLFEQVDDDGERVYSEEEVLHLVPFVLLAEGAVDPKSLSEEVAGMLGAFLSHLGLERDASPADVGNAIRAHYEAHPVNEDLLSGLLELVSTEGSDPGERMRDAKKLLGQAGDALPTLGQQPGNAGPLARFTLSPPDEKPGPDTDD